MMSVTRSQLLGFRARRQYLAPGARGHTPEDVLTILQALQPFPPIADSMPGSAPHPRSRVEDYQDAWAERWRAEGRLVKGRFMHRNIAYVADADLALYAAAFRQPLPGTLSWTARRILDLLEQHGPLHKSQLREMTAIERKRFDRALLVLNLAFEVMEIQTEVDWDSPWALPRHAYPGADPDGWQPAEAQAEVLRRFTKAFGPATLTQMAGWSGWRQRTVEERLDHLLSHGAIVHIEAEGEEEPAYLASEEVEALPAAAPVEPFTLMLPTNDPFALPHWPLLRARYRPYPLPHCYGVLVVDGEMVGAAWGQYKRRFIQIEELSIAPEVMGDPPRMDDVLAQLVAFFGGDQVLIHIGSLNQQAEAPWVAEILERNGFVRQAGYYAKGKVD
jgi:hypothetical protein